MTREEERSRKENTIATQTQLLLLFMLRERYREEDREDREVREESGGRNVCCVR